MSSKRAKLTGIHHFFKPAVQETSAAVDCDSRSDNDSTSTLAATPGTSTSNHVENVVDNTSDKHLDDGSCVAGANGGSVAGYNIEPTLLVSDQPNQPDPLVIPSQKTKTQYIHFQAKWYKEYPWLHYDPELQKVTCFTCMGQKETVCSLSVATER